MVKWYKTLPFQGKIAGSIPAALTFNMKDFIDEHGDLLIIIVMVAFLLFLAAVTDSDAFNRVNRVCSEVGGTVVRSTRDYICVK